VSDGPVLEILHLVTQDNQPYGSARLACELCGLWCIRAPGHPVYTDDRDFHKNPPDGYVACDGKSDGQIVAEVMES
jgi:hypothetical protein